MHYYALVRPNLTSAGMMSQYVLNVRVLPTNAVDFPNLRVTSVTDPPAAGTQSGDMITLTFEVTNQGNLATGVAAWTDRIVLSTNDAYGDLDDLQLALVPRNGALNPTDSYLVNHQVTIPNGLSGNFYVFIETDSSNAVDEILQEGDNVGRSLNQFNVALRDYPDLVIENLSIMGPDGSGNYDLTWDLANRGTGTAPSGSAANLQVINTTTSQTLTDMDFATTGALAADQVEAQNHSVNTTAPGFYVVTITADPANVLYEFGLSGHALAEQNSVLDNFQIFQFYDIAVTASPPAGGNVSGAGSYREGETVTVQATPETGVLPYAFINWTENGSFVSSAATYQFTASASRNLVAVFGLPQFQVTGTVSPPGSGTISGLGTYPLDATANLMANPSPGYLFNHWEENSINIGGNAALSFSVTGNRAVMAFFEEATPEHIVTLATDPPGLSAIPGGATYMNGQSINPIAPTPIEQGDFEYLFERWELNGIFLTNDATFEKTFATLDPPNMDYVAIYDERSLKPVVEVVVTNYGTLVPLSDDLVFSVTFDRSMNTAVLPVLALQSGNAPQIPAIGAGGQWIGNATYQSPAVTIGDQNGGAYTLQVSAATDTDGRVMDADTSFGFTVDALPPPNPAIVLASTTADSATVSWAGYPAPVDLSGFRYYLETTDYATVDGLAAVSGGNSAARAFTFQGLQPDQEYFAAVTGIDVAGNSNPLVSTLRILLESVVPPPVPLVLNDTGLDSVLVDWSAYDTGNLVGFDGFRVFVETAPFVDITTLTPVADVEKTVTSHSLTGLDRSLTYHIAVVGYNRLNEFESAVTPSQWTDPLAGTIAADLTIGGAGQNIEVLSSPTVENGATLTIEPGTTLQFAPGTSLTVMDGRLMANGTDLEPIHFTSTNEFAPGMTPVRGEWNGLILADGVQVSELSHVWVRYGQGLQVQAGSPLVDGLYAVQNQGGGLALSGTANLTTSRCYLVFNESGITAGASSILNITDSILKNNTNFNVAQSGSAAVDASSNWWGTTSGPGIDAKLDGVVTANTRSPRSQSWARPSPLPWGKP